MISEESDLLSTVDRLASKEGVPGSRLLLLVVVAQCSC